MSRNTIQQEIICGIVKSMCTHPSPDEVYKEVHDLHPSISRATVYRVLNKLADKGELLKVHMPNTADRFDFRTDNHIHIFCTECGRVFDAEIESSSKVLGELNGHIRSGQTMKDKGFKISKINISLEGICPECKEVKAKS